MKLASRVLVALAWASTASAHHPADGAAPEGSGVGWLLLAGVLLVGALGAWVLLAPDRDDPDDPTAQPG